MYPKNDIVYFTLFPWDHSYSSVSLSLSRTFAKNNRVFYINHPFTYKDFLSGYRSEKVKKRRRNLLLGKLTYDTGHSINESFIPIHPPNTIPINFLPNGALYRRLKKWNDKILLKTIHQVIRDYQLKDFLFLNCFNPFYVGTLPESFGQMLNIYQCIDDMTQEAYTAKHAYRLEEEVIRKADFTFVTSKKLYTTKSALNPNTYILHNAVDWNIFRHSTETRFDRPADLAHIKNKMIGFTGNLNEYRVNYALLRQIALHHRDKTLVLVGPLNSNDYREYGLDKLPNVVLTGGKPIAELPRYLQHFDCLIIPFLSNKLTESVYPLKINEYLSSGKPVVSTNFSEDIRGFEDWIYLAETERDFLLKIDLALQEKDANLAQGRIEVARSNTWEARVEQFWKIIEKKLVN